MKNAMSRRKIEKCKEYVQKENGQGKPEDLSTDIAKKAIGEFETEHGITG